MALCYILYFLPRKIASWNFQASKKSFFITITKQVGYYKQLSKLSMENFLQLDSIRQLEYMLTKAKAKSSCGIFIRKIATFYFGMVL